MTDNNSTNNSSTLDNLLQIDDEEPKADSSNYHNSSIPEEVKLAETTLTKHTVVTSPWSRLLIIALPFGLVFLTIFLMLNGLFNPTLQPLPSSLQPKNSSEALDKLDQKDGDVYAKLALNQQQNELSKINKDKSSKPSNPQRSVKKEEKVVNPGATSPRTQQQQPTPRTRTSYYEEPRRSFISTRVSPTTTTVSARVKSLDPDAELNRLRSIGSYGKIADTDTSLLERESPLPKRVFTQTEQVNQSDNDFSNSQPKVTEISQQNTPNSIEKIIPRWESEIKTTKHVTLANNYLPQENQILQEKQTRYLTVGEFASGVLVTPVVKQQADVRNNIQNNLQQNDDGRRFVARLTEDLHDNNADVAIPSGSLLAVEVISVTGGSYATVQVTSIIKDNTEYPISNGAISVLGQDGKPLIAQQFHDSGGEIARYDLTVGLVSGLGQVGTILNQSDSSSTVSSSSGGTFTSNVTSKESRNIGGAFLQGAFGKLSDIIGKRAQTSTQEIAARPNVWYIPQGTKVTFLVNRSLEV
ncbi:TrbI/VirB10 family protein [Nostoc sp. CHAB 5836]|uniref:TrbI/VirB10 family protein n=1 Tax=Nostoc sp. CHAB 5836 TaxID=2780404 RepID=UPI001E380491|nr:TrbI/VirB10 family protein [Nostoc sp. CHAB 5836]MCC5618211.1 TrbI/VirB10 family protein [Nostoc sp. CHAB 5836]